MCNKIVYVQFMSVFVPVIIDASGLTDDNVSYDTVYLGEWKCFMIGDLTSVSFKNIACSEAFLLKRVLVLADFRYQLEQVVVLCIKYILKSEI